MTQFTRLVARAVLLSGIAFTLNQAMATSPNAGAKAPPFLPERWVNQKGPVSPAALKGRVILIDRWATWCGPCVAMIPHMNELADKYGKQGLTIIGITNEPVDKVKPFLEKKDIHYMIGSGGAKGYVTRAIPHCWLISAAGKVVWEGHPAELKEDLIKEQLKNVVLPMQFELPAALSAAQRALNEGRYGDGLRLLKPHLSGTNPELATAAKETVDKVVTLGKGRLQEAEGLLKKNEYGKAARILKGLITSYKGTEVGDSAQARDAALRKDPKIGVEYEGEELLARADELVTSNRLREAATLAEQITKSRKFDNTKVRQKAQDLLGSIGPATG